MHIQFERHFLKKRYPLQISRGTDSGKENLFVMARFGDAVGIGEMAPGSLTGAEDAGAGQQALEALIASGLEDLSIQDCWARGRELGTPPCALAALDMALWDCQAKRAGLPLYALLGLARRAVPSSITIGINPPEVCRERVTEILARLKPQCLKIKLGSPEGIEADQASFSAIYETVAAHQPAVKLLVDANGGWDLQTAKTMCTWLSARDVEYVEQPLAEGDEESLSALFAKRPLPIYIDESCRFATDAARYHDRVDGVNLKLMKCGGITEALRIAATARAHGLKLMIGCMGESSVSIAAGAALSALFDSIDLDSHLNLAPDPATGLLWTDGRVLPAIVPGHGGVLCQPN